MAKSSNDVSNAEIIELTDLLEPGDPSKVRDGDADLDDLLGGDDDASLDDLLNVGDGDLKGMGDIDLPDDSGSGGAGDDIDMDGLDDLLADMNGGKATSDDDLEAMLGGVAKGSPAKAASQDDIDDLLAGLDDAPSEPKAQNGASKPASQDDIDDLLAGLDDAPSEPTAQEGASKAAAQDDIDDLLAGLDDDAQTADLPDDELDLTADQASAPKADDTDYDIEALLAATDEAELEMAPAPSAAEARVAASVSPAEEVSLAADSETLGPDEPVALDFDETEEDLEELLKDIDTDLSLDETPLPPLAGADAQRIEALEARLASLDGIEERLAALEAGRATLAPGASESGATPGADGIEEAVERVLAQRLDDVSASLREAIKADLVAVIEKAVPAAAARIIREEIAALAETLDEDD